MVCIENYLRLFKLSHWMTALKNFAIFGLLYVGLSAAIGIFLAIILDPGIGLERIVRSWGFEAFRFDWIKNSDFSIYTVVIAAIWRSSPTTS
jgi:glucose/mannose transport system permease protein